MAPETGWLEDEISFWDGLFSGAMVVLGRVILQSVVNGHVCLEVGTKTSERSGFSRCNFMMFSQVECFLVFRSYVLPWLTATGYSPRLLYHEDLKYIIRHVV